MKRSIPSSRTVIGAALVALTLAPAAAAAKSPEKVSEKLRQDVTVEGIRAHQQALQDIATLNGGNRASGTPGYDASVAYVAGKLRDAGYDPTIQTFTFRSFTELAEAQFERVSPSPRAYANPEEFTIMEYSGSGDVTAPVTPVDVVVPPGEPNSSTSGCESGDFAGFPAGHVALVQRGTCTFGAKAQNAQAAGASAVVIFNEGQPGRDGVVAGTLGDDTTATIPALGTSFAVGQELVQLAQAGETVVRVVTSTQIQERETANVLADLAPKKARDAGKVVLVGAHLDSVDAGPGMNDNGSGSATTLEIAEQMAADKAPRNPVRFAFWGAEESGLVGSSYYVSQLSEAQAAEIGLNLNFDMLGSPNFVRFVYDGDGSSGGPAGPAGSGDIERMFLDYFASQGLATDPTPFNGRSDYGPFIAIGIPAGGLFSGAEGVKTAEQAAVYGGVVGEAYDRCYHQACDTFSNVSIRGLDELADGAAHATAFYAGQRADRQGEAAKAKARAARRRSARAQAARARGREFHGHTAIR